MKKFIKSCGLLLAFAMTALVFVGCAPSNLEKAEAKMKDAEYVVETIEANDAMKEMMEGVVGGIYAVKAGISTSGIEGEYVYAYLFESTKAAKTYFEKYDNQKTPEGMRAERNGKWIISGTEAAVEVFLG